MQFLIDIGLSVLYFCIFLLLCAWSFRFWMMYVNQKFLNSLTWTILEIKLPREILKSPFATETAIACLIQNGGVGSSYDRIFNGKLPVFSSLEIASIEGVIHFYVRAQSRFKSLIEANFYAQYPGIEIVEADDYTGLIRYHHLSKEVSMFGATYPTAGSWSPINPKTGKKYQKDGEDYKMKKDFVPIKTYVDYGLDKDPKEEFKIDPLSTILEVMGNIGKGEHFWYQILIQDESVYNGKKFSKFYVNDETHQHFSLKEMADMFKKQTRTAGYALHGDVVYDEYGYEKIRKVERVPDGVDENGKDKFKEVPITLTYNIPVKDPTKGAVAKEIPKKEMDLTFEEKEELESINKKFTKPLALTIIRFMYIAKKENFKASNIPAIISFPKPFKGLNSFGLIPSDPYDYPWQNIGKRRSSWRAEELFEEYVEREGFFPHNGDRETLEENEDRFFWLLSMRQRKLFRMFYEAIFYPFDHPQAKTACTLNLEEIATLWHLPGATAATPGLPRIESNKGVAPTNLPL